MAPPKPAKPDTSFFDDLKLLDPGVANRWKARSHGDPKFVLDGPDVDAIVQPMIHNLGTITQLQAAALAKLVVEVKFTAGGTAVLRVWLSFAQSDGRFIPAAEPLTNAADLKPIFNALGMGTVSFINFVSPGSGLTYAPSGYIAIQQLITRRAIIVLEVKISGLEQKADLPIRAQYRSDINKLFVYQSLTPAEETVTVVHECTHAIQDWRNVRSLMKFTEADAFIAGAIADLSRRDGTVVFVGPIIDKAVEAARIVIKGPAVPSNKAWTDAYAAVVSAIEASDEYKDLANVPMLTVEKGEGTRESDAMDLLVTTIEKKQKEDFAAFSRWAQDAWKTTFGGIPQGIADALP